MNHRNKVQFKLLLDLFFPLICLLLHLSTKYSHLLLFSLNRMDMFPTTQLELSCAKHPPAISQGRHKSFWKCSTTVSIRSVPPHLSNERSCAVMWTLTNLLRVGTWTPWSAEQPTLSSLRPMSLPGS